MSNGYQSNEKDEPQLTSYQMTLYHESPSHFANRLAWAFCTLLVCLSSANAQTILEAQANATAQRQRSAIGEWRTHLPTDAAFDVTACETYTAWATEGSIILRYTATGEIRRLDKVNALSQSDVLAVTCNPNQEGQLIVLYEDGAIDIIEEERVVRYLTAIPDATIPGLRSVRGIDFGTDATSTGRAFIYADFGFVILDPVEGIFLDDVRTPLPLTGVATLAGDLYLGTPDGVSVLRDYNDQPTLRDTTQYVRLDTTLLPSTSDYVWTIQTWKNEVYVGFANDLFALPADGSPARRAGGGSGLRCVDLEACENELIATYLNLNSGQLDLIVTTDDGNGWARVPNTCSRRVLGTARASDGAYAFASSTQGAGLCSTGGLQEECDCIQIDGPFQRDVFDIDINSGVVAVVGGGLTEQNGYTFSGAGLYVYNLEGEWVNYNRQTDPATFDNESDASSYPFLLDFVGVAVAESGGVYAGAFYEGLAEVRPDGSSQRFDERNSSLGFNLQDGGRVRIGGVDIDENNTTWVTNYGAARSLSAMTADSSWRSFSLSGCGGADFLQVNVDPSTGVVWIIDAGRGLIAFDAKGTLDDPSDDECMLFGLNNGLPSPDVESLAFDRNDNLWIGTRNGITTFRGNPFEDGFSIVRPTAVIDGLNGNAFDGELVTAIAIDGANRKYIGTANGLFLVSENGSEQLDFYTSNNSPLLDDEITALEFDDESGQLWIGTASGLMTLQTETTGGREFTHGNVEVFPQPVRPEYEGPIAIRGLASDSDVKITDAAGRLVFETTSLGGQAVWDGFDYTGGRPAAGVYFVWATAASDFGLTKPATVVAKIALVR